MQGNWNYIYEKAYNELIGNNEYGNLLYKVRVVVNRIGELVTAFRELD